MLPTLDRVYDNERAREVLGWRPQYDFRRALRAIAAGADWRSALARQIGSKGYHPAGGRPRAGPPAKVFLAGCLATSAAAFSGWCRIAACWHLLDNIMWNCLSGPHARFATGAGAVRRYAPGFSPIVGCADPQHPDFATLANYCEPGETFYIDTGRARLRKAGASTRKPR